MKFFGWFFVIVVILLVGFMMVSSETQEKIIKNSPSILAKILEKLQNVNESNIIKIDNVDYEKVGKPMQNIMTEISCETDDMCDKYFNECLTHGGCKCKEGICYIQKI